MISKDILCDKTSQVGYLQSSFSFLPLSLVHGRVIRRGIQAKQNKYGKKSARQMMSRSYG
jgi:hypothetical protein